jgi:thiamine-phosphate pyrophosphorylase
MKLDKDSMLLYAVTDRAWLKGQTLTEQVEACLQGGATFIQLREKELDEDAFLTEAMEIKALCEKFDVPFVINDNIGIAASCNADGVHVGQSDMSAKAARERLGADKIIGVSVQTVSQAIKAELEGADYLGVGAVFSTSTKQDADTVTIGTLSDICKSVSIPVVAIGGISVHNILKLKGTGIAGVAVVSALFAQPDILAAARELLTLSKETVTA